MNSQLSALSPQLGTAPRPFPKIIGFAGPAGVGKTTAALEVVACYRDFCRISFADPIRRMLLELGLEPGAMSHEKEHPNRFLCGRTPRHAMQTLGTEWGRQLIGPDIWINASHRRLLHILDLGSRAVFDDVRFDNEARMIREAGGYVVCIRGANEAFAGVSPRMAGENVGQTPGGEHAATVHASEAGISPDLIDARIEAGTSQENFRGRILAHFNGFAAY